MMGHEVLTVAWEMVRTPLFTEHFLRCQTFLSLVETRHTQRTALYCTSHRPAAKPSDGGGSYREAGTGGGVV